MENNGKMGLFLQNARLLSDTLGIVPLLYGSLGLEYLSGDDLAADDIDILIPKTFITDRWPEFKGILESYGYILTDAHEHTFVREGVSYSYADVEDLETFAGIRCEEILRREADSVPFMILSPEQYLRVYKRSSRDGYRARVRGKKDAEKIRFIESRLL
jgi:hypothetical protein